MENKKTEHLAEFKKMPAWTQAVFLEKEGTELARRTFNNWTIKLYSIDHYYVELWEKQEIKVTTTFRKSAKATAVLEPYLDSLQVEGMVNY